MVYHEPAGLHACFVSVKVSVMCTYAVFTWALFFVFVGFKLAQEIKLCLNSLDDIAMLREDTLID